jgi:hypothetical protein
MNTEAIKEAIKQAMYKQYVIVDDFSITVSETKRDLAKYSLEININATQYEVQND